MDRHFTTAWRLALAASCLLPLPAAARAQVGPSNGGPEWAPVQRTLGRRGAMQPGRVLRFGFPRTDLKVAVGDVALRPGFALGSWVAFERPNRASSDAMVMGDLVLTEDEVAPVMAALQRGGVEQTALHNHLLHETPRVMYMHITAHGDATKIAQAIRAALAATKTPVPSGPAPGPAPAPAPALALGAAPIDLDTAAIDRALGVRGKGIGGVYQASIPRGERVTEHGIEVPPALGVATSINFQPTGGGRAAITGDFVLLASEVNPVIRALDAHGIQVTALHSHMLDERPRLLFIHFWANDDAVALAQGLRAALDRTNVRRP